MIRQKAAGRKGRRDSGVEGQLMKREQKEAKPAGRREFLKLASLGAVAGTVAAAAGTERADAALEPDQGAKGYRETAHVKKVYELARF